MMDFLLQKPVLVGLHLGFAILGIDALLWLAGELLANPVGRFRLKMAAWLGFIGLFFSWVVGGYYYVKFYGALVKPEILAGNAPWAHGVAMEAKEHIFLFLIPVSLVILFASCIKREDLDMLKIRGPLIALVLVTAVSALSLGLMGYIISAAARWGSV